MNIPKHFIAVGIVSIALASCLSGAPALAQDQQPAPPPDQPPTAAEQPPSDAGLPPATQGVPPAANQPAVPPALTLPEGSVIPVRVIGQLSSDKNQVGDRFSASLDQPLIANGWVVARRGQIVTGRVVVAQKASHGGNSQLGVQLIELTLVDGQILPVNTQLAQSSASRPGLSGRDVSTVATTTGIGAVIGAVAGGGTGAAIGAGLGATAGAATVLSTRGNPTIIYPEQLLTFRLQAPLAISTENSQVAFQPVKQSDYSRGDQDVYARPRLGRGPSYYAGPGYYAPYPYGYDWVYYPFVPYVGFYGYYGGFYGPRFYGGFRGFRR